MRFGDSNARRTVALHAFVKRPSSLRTLMKNSHCWRWWLCVYRRSTHTCIENASFYHQSTERGCLDHEHNAQQLTWFVEERDVRRRVWYICRRLASNTRECTGAGLGEEGDDGVVGPCHFESKAFGRSLSCRVFVGTPHCFARKPPDLAAVCKRHVSLGSCLLTLRRDASSCRHYLERRVDSRAISALRIQIWLLGTTPMAIRRTTDRTGSVLIGFYGRSAWALTSCSTLPRCSKMHQ